MSDLFDDVARTLASPATGRRKALKLLGGLIAGGILSAVGIGHAAAQNDVEPELCGGKRCKTDQRCCNGHCIHPCNPRLPSCPIGSTCVACNIPGGIFRCKAV
jgi:hypothetical protein